MYIVLFNMQDYLHQAEYNRFSQRFKPRILYFHTNSTEPF